jgi:hypothetical protein
MWMRESGAVTISQPSASMKSSDAFQSFPNAFGSDIRF